MATSKQPVTVPTDASVDEFLAAVPDERRRADAERLCGILREVTGEPAVMWGPSIVGFGSYRYTYESGRTGDWPLAGFSPRKQQLVLYLVGGFAERHASVLARLGPHQTGKGCLYLKRLDDVDERSLRELIDRTVRVHKGVDRAANAGDSGRARGTAPGVATSGTQCPRSTVELLSGRSNGLSIAEDG